MHRHTHANVKAYLSMDRFVGDIWILFVTGTFVVFTSMRLPVAQAHPAKVVFTIKTLLYANNRREKVGNVTM